MKKLSELKNDVEVSYEYGDVYTVGELKAALLDPMSDDEFSHRQWYIIERKRWHPSAQSMIDDYIESESHDMYEEWEESATDCITPDHVAAIQAVLDKAFEGDFATEYWTLAEEIKIDVSPKSEGESK